MCQVSITLGGLRTPWMKALCLGCSINSRKFLLNKENLRESTELSQSGIKTKRGKDTVKRVQSYRNRKNSNRSQVLIIVEMWELRSGQLFTQRRSQ